MITLIEILFQSIFKGTGNVQTPKKKISWNDIINPNYNPNRISPWESNKTKPTQRQRFPTPIHPSSNGGAAPLRQRSNGVQNNQQPTKVVKPKLIVYEWKVIESNFQPQQKLTTTVPPTTNLPATTTPMPDNSYYYDMTTMSPGQFLHNFFFGHDYFYYYPDYYTATVSPTPTFRYSGKKRSTFVSSTEEPEYESEDMTTSLPTKTSSGGSGIEAEDITTTAKPNVPGAKFTTTTEKPVTEEIEAEDRTTTPSSKGQKTQQATTTQATEQEAESATTKAPKTTTTVKTKNVKGSLIGQQILGSKNTLKQQPAQIQNGGLRKRFPPKYRFANTERQFRFPVLKEANTLPNKMRSLQKQKSLQNRISLKAKGVFKSLAVRPNKKTLNMRAAVIPKQYSFTKHRSTNTAVYKNANPMTVNKTFQQRQGVPIMKGKCLEFRKCPSQLQPVCGTDGLSYRNRCTLKKVACL